MIGIRTGLVVVVAALTCVSTAFAQTGTLSVTVDEAITRALSVSPRTAESRALAAAADAGVVQARAAQYPAVSAETGVVRTNHVDEFGMPQLDGSFRVIFPDIPTIYRARAQVTVPLYTAGRIDASVTSAEADARAVRAAGRGTEADLSLDTSIAYWTLVTMRERAGVLERALARSDAHVADMRSRVEAGLLPPNDLLSSEAQRARQNVQLIQARNAAAVAEARLGRLIGADAGERIEPMTPVTDQSAAARELIAMSADALAARARADRPDRLAALERRTAQYALADVARRSRYPNLLALAALEPARPNARFVPRTDTWHTAWDLGVNLSWSPFDGGRARGQETAARAQIEALTQRMADIDSSILVDIRERLLDLAAVQASIAAAGEGIAAAAEARRVVGERFTVGVIASTDVLDADLALLEAELECTTLAASLRISEARLIRVVGGR